MNETHAGLELRVADRVAGINHRDLLDALNHMSDFNFEIMIRNGGRCTLRLEDFKLSSPKMIRVNDIPDDLSSWAKWGDGELLEYDDEERQDEVEGFRGVAWARRAQEWTPQTMPPIVIVETPEGDEGVGDGRGRVTYALGMGWRSVPAVTLTPKMRSDVDKVRD